MHKEDQDLPSFLEDDFNAPAYVSGFLHGIKPGEESKKLQTLRNALKSRNDSASETIKDIVFEHYKHFIETSKEISNLEREIYQLSSLLTEQKNLIENLMEMSGQDKKSSSCNGSIVSGNSLSQNQLHALMLKMDGVATILNSLSDNERILLQNQMVLLNPDTMEPEHPVYLVLLFNTLLIGYPANNATTKCPYHLVTNQALDNLAAINFKSHSQDGSGTDHVLQLLIFPEQIYVKCENARVKRDWLEAIELTKRRQEQEKSMARQATIRARRRSIISSIADKMTASKGVLDENNAIKEKKKMTTEDTQWLNDLILELQDVVSHRHMEQAVEMLLEWKSCDCQDATINAKFTTLERTIVKMLSDEVKQPGALHGGSRALSKPISLLISLNQPVYAMELYLKRRREDLRGQARELTISEEPLSYVRQISTLFINEIIDVAREFHDQRKHYPLILQWSSSELSTLLSLIRRHVIEVAPTMTVLAHTWRILMSNCENLIPIGIDLSFEVHRLLSPALTTAMENNFANVMDSVCLRISEEKWKPYNLQSESNLNRFLEEMSDIGLSIDWAVSPSSRYSINISQPACQFSRIAISLSRDFTLLNSSHLQKLTASFETMLWCEYLFHLSTGPNNEIHRSTCHFIVGQVIPLCDQIYCGEVKGRISHLLPEKFPALLKFSKTDFEIRTASETIKDIVFEHYKHFIETSKEISNLEREIYQLSSLLTEQKNLIENLMEMSGQDKKSSSCNGSIVSGNSLSQNQLHALMLKMDGVATILNSLSDNERILLQNQMVLLNPDTMEPEHPVYLVLLSNTLLIGYPANNATTKCPYHLVTNQALDNLAAINFKSHSQDGSGTDHVLQLLIFPEQIYVKCENARVKRDWLEAIELTKRRQEQEKSMARQATIRARRRSIISSIADKMTASKGVLDENNAIKEKKKMTTEDTQWLNDLILELQDVVSHRHMEQAVEMLLEWKSCDCQDATINAKFTTLERTIVKMLSDEVKQPGALHGGSRALSKPISLLISLNQPVYAMELYLKRRREDLRGQARELTISEEPLSYVRQISTLFINEIIDVAREFHDQRKHYPLILQWSSSELSTLLSLIRRHVIEVAPTMTVLAHTWRILMSNCENLIPIGIDLSFEVHRLLSPALTTAMENNFANVMDSVCLRISEEKWKPYNLQSESNLNRFLEEMSDIGLSIDWAVSPSSRYSINISQPACQFSRIAISLSRDFTLLNSSHLQKLTASFETMLWCEYLFHLSTGPNNEIHRSTCHFIVGQVIPLCDQIYCGEVKGRISHLLPEKFPALLKFSKTGSFDEEVANV